MTFILQSMQYACVYDEVVMATAIVKNLDGVDFKAFITIIKHICSRQV